MGDDEHEPRMGHEEQREDELTVVVKDHLEHNPKLKSEVSPKADVAYQGEDHEDQSEVEVLDHPMWEDEDDWVQPDLISPEVGPIEDLSSKDDIGKVEVEVNLTAVKGKISECITSVSEVIGPGEVETKRL